MTKLLSFKEFPYIFNKGEIGSTDKYTDGSFTAAISNSFRSPLEKIHSCRFGII